MLSRIRVLAKRDEVTGELSQINKGELYFCPHQISFG